MALGGALLRFGQTGLRTLELLASIVGLAIFSYFLGVLTHHGLHIPNWERAVEGITGAAVLYTLCLVLLTLFLGGVAFFAILAVVLDILFVGGFSYVAYATRNGSNSCKGNVLTPLGAGPASNHGPGTATLHQACQLNTAVFAISFINIFLFLLTAVMSVLLFQHHRKEKRYGPSPSNNYTKGSGRTAFWKRNKTHNTRDAELATAGAATATHDTRPSHETGFTGSTMHGPMHTEAKYGEPGYGQPGYGQAGYVAPAHHATTATNY